MLHQKLNRNEKRALEALLLEPTITEAAERCGLERQTLHRYLNDKTFIAALNERESQVLGAATRRLVQLVKDANKVLADIMASDEADLTNKRLAAKTILDSTLKMIEMRKFSERLDALEQEIYG